MLLVVFFVVGVALTIGPWLMPGLTTVPQFMLSGIGVLILITVSIAAVITKLYRKASANMAFVRTGQGGARVVKDGGTIVVPVVHHVIPVSLETMRLNVERRGPHALITRDNLRVDLSAEFYIKVQANTDDILQAARSLGSRSVRADAVSELVQEKLVSALRTVAATKDLHELHSKRDEFANAVQEIVTHDLSSNGLTLESVTISALDQTDPGQLQEENVFDAQGLRKIAEITQQARVERNEIERNAEQSVVEKNVSTRKKVLGMEREQSEFEAEQRMQVANVQAVRQREIEEFKLAQEEAIAQRGIAKQKTVEMTEVDRRLTIEQAEINKTIALLAKEREQETAAITKQQAVEVAERAKEVAVAEKEQQRAAAQAAMLAAEAERESAKQRVLTVQVTAEAEREAEKKLIAAKQVITQDKIREETGADVLAYTQVKDAQGQRDAANLQFEAKLRLAEGDAQSAVKRAEGDKAAKMVDVDVERQKVNVEQARVEVERQSLSNKQEFDDAALKFELERLRINAEREVRIQAAEAMGKMLASASIKIFGDPETMSRMTQQFMRAASYGTAAEGLLSSLPADARGMFGNLVQQLAGGEGNGHAAPAAPTNGHAEPQPMATPVDVAPVVERSMASERTAIEPVAEKPAPSNKPSTGKPKS